MERQQLNIFTPLTQWWNMQFDGINAVKQILPKLLPRYHGMNISIGRTNQSHINLQRLRSPQTNNLLLLYRRQQLRLHSER